MCVVVRTAVLSFSAARLVELNVLQLMSDNAAGELGVCVTVCMCVCEYVCVYVLVGRSH